jgi:hypothetical protein
MGAQSQEDAQSAPTDRKCGRCQRAFAGDPTLYFQTDWALCPDCTEILLPAPKGDRG